MSLELDTVNCGDCLELMKEMSDKMQRSQRTIK